MNTDPKILRLEERVQQIEEEMKVLGIFSDFLKKRQNIILNTSEQKYKDITACITIPEVKK